MGGGKKIYLHREYKATEISLKMKSIVVEKNSQIHTFMGFNTLGNCNHMQPLKLLTMPFPVISHFFHKAELIK